MTSSCSQNDSSSMKGLPVVEKSDYCGVTVSLMGDPRNAGRRDSLPLVIRVCYMAKRIYISTGMKFNSAKDYMSFVNARDSRKDKREILDYFNMIMESVKGIIISNNGRFSFEDLNVAIGKGEKSNSNDCFTFWSNLAEQKIKVKTREMYQMALRRFKEFRRNRPIELREITTDTISKFSKWLETEAKSGVVKKGEKPSKPLSLDSRMYILRATRAMTHEAKSQGLIESVPEFKIHAGNRRRANAITVADVLKLWNYWTSLDDKGKQSAKGRAVGRWLLLYCLNGMNMADMAKLRWSDKSSEDNEFPQFGFVRSKIDRANRPVGKLLDETLVPIIDELRTLLNVYASPFEIGALVFPDIFLNATTDEQKAIRVHDCNRRITLNIADVCDELGIQRVTPAYARNSFISALAHHGVMASYIDFAVGHTTSEVSALLAGYVSNMTDEMMHHYNQKIFIVPTIQQV